MVMSMAVTLAAARGRRFSIPDRSGHLGDAEVATARQRHGPEELRTGRTVTTEQREWTRLLAWEGCLNARDLGGYATDLADYGVRAVVDLRLPDELADRPNPFAVWRERQEPARSSSALLCQVKGRGFVPRLESSGCQGRPQQAPDPWGGPAPSPRCTDTSVRSTPPKHRRCTSASLSP